MSGNVLFETHEAYLEHRPGRGHPERPDRLRAVIEGVRRPGVCDAVSFVTPRPATRGELERVHAPGYLDGLERFIAGGGGHLDADTAASEGSWRAAILAAGGGLDAIDRLDHGEGDAAFVAVRPPGHHALKDRAMGFCLINNVAVAAAALADRGERVLIVDWDAHHGNGTQGVFYADNRVMYVSMHEYPLYPGTGWLDETGAGEGRGYTVNIPFPAGTTGDAYLAAVDEIIAPLAESFRPTWVIVSAGFDGHRADPLTGLGLSAGDFADLTGRIKALVPNGRLLAMLEGGYDLDALSDCAGACVAGLAGVSYRPEPASAGGPGRPVVEAVNRARRQLKDDGRD